MWAMLFCFYSFISHCILHFHMLISENETQGAQTKTQGTHWWIWNITQTQNGGTPAPSNAYSNYSSNFTPPCPLNPHPSRTQTADESQGPSAHAPLSSPQPPPTTHKNGISTPKQDPDKTKPSEPQSSKTDQASSVVMTPKLARAGPRISDKVRAFEERRASVDLPGGVSGRAVSFDSDDGRKKAGGPGAAQKRTAFKQRASSLEDQTSYSQRVQSYQSKFAEELQRIKKLVGKPSLKKAFSTEQLSQKERVTTGKLEPIPPQVVKKLEARERAVEEREGNIQGKGLRENPAKDKMTQPDSQGKPVDSTAKISVTMETAPVHQLPGQPLPSSTRTSLTRFGENPSLLMKLCVFKIFTKKHYFSSLD